MSKLSATQRKALELAITDAWGKIPFTINESTKMSLAKKGYAIAGLRDVFRPGYIITRQGIEALSLDADKTLIWQAEQRLNLMRESYMRVLKSREMINTMYTLGDLMEARQRVSKAEFELAALECAIG